MSDTDDGDVSSSSLVRELSVKEDGGVYYVNLDTSNLEGDYALRVGGMFINDGTDDIIFEVATQGLDAEWEETSVSTDTDVKLELDSVRANYNVTVASDELDYEQLQALFVDHTDGLNETTELDHVPLDRHGYDRTQAGFESFTENDGYITLNLSDSDNFRGDGAIVADFDYLESQQGIDPAEYEFEIEVTDTVANAHSSVIIGGNGTDFEYILSLEANEAQAVGFPGPIDGTYGDVFAGVEGTIWKYDAESNSWEQPDSDQEIKSLDAVVVTPDESTTLSIAFEDTDSDTPTAPSDQEVSTGWNLIAPPQYGDIEEAFGAGTAEPSRVIDVFDHPDGQPFDAGDGFSSYTFGETGSDIRVSAFTGYWVYIDEDGTIAVNLYEGITLNEANDLLNP